MSVQGTTGLDIWKNVSIHSSVGFNETGGGSPFYLKNVSIHSSVGFNETGGRSPFYLKNVSIHSSRNLHDCQPHI
jgi:hypothetical protein